MEKKTQPPAVAPVQSDTSSQVEALSSPPDESLEVSTDDSSSYIKGWRLHFLSLGSAQPPSPWARLTIIAL